MKYNPNTGSFERSSTYERKVFEKAQQPGSEQLDHLSSVIQETSPEEIFEAPDESPLVVEFRTKKKEIMKELRELVLRDPAMNRFMLTGDIDDLEKSTELTDGNRRKWALFLKYADVWDDDLKNLGYLELKKIYALAKNNS